MVSCMVVWHHLHGDFEAARALADQHIPTAGGLLGVQLAMHSALASCALNDFARAATWLQGLGVIDQELWPYRFTFGREIAALTALDEGDLSAADAAAREVLEGSVFHDRRREIIIGFQLLTAVAARNGAWTEVARLAGITAAEGTRRALSRRNEPFSRLFDNAVASAVDALGPTAFDAALTEGEGLSLDEAMEFVNRSRGERGRPTIGWASLTPTERRVADLVRTGMTNTAVGAELLMGAETVKTHLSRVFAKLGVNNRTKLAALTPPAT